MNTKIILKKIIFTKENPNLYFLRIFSYFPPLGWTTSGKFFRFKIKKIPIIEAAARMAPIDESKTVNKVFSSSVSGVVIASIFVEEVYVDVELCLGLVKAELKNTLVPVLTFRDVSPILVVE